MQDHVSFPTLDGWPSYADKPRKIGTVRSSLERRFARPKSESTESKRATDDEGRRIGIGQEISYTEVWRVNSSLIGDSMAKHFLALVSLFMAAVVTRAQPAPTQHTVDPELRHVVEEFVKAVDNADIAAVAAAYGPEFLNVRVADDGGFVRLSGAQILAMLKGPGGRAPGLKSIPTRETVIQHAEAIGDMGFVLMTRVKDLDIGWEPMYYSLVWQKRDGKWELLREFVHQRSVPRQR